MSFQNFLQHFKNFSTERKMWKQQNQLNFSLLILLLVTKCFFCEGGLGFLKFIQHQNLVKHCHSFSLLETTLFFNKSQKIQTGFLYRYFRLNRQLRFYSITGTCTSELALSLSDELSLINFLCFTQRHSLPSSKAAKQMFEANNPPHIQGQGYYSLVF